METKDTSYAQNLIDRFDDKIEEGNELTDTEKRTIASEIPDKEKLQDGLPLLLKKATDMKTSIEDCDIKIKTWQESKKLWNGRHKAFMDVLETLVGSLNLPGATMKADGIKLSTSSRSSLEVDEDWILTQYEAMAKALQSQLPDYIKVSIALDKTKLSAFLKTDNTMLVQYPDKIHTKTTTSTTIR